MLEAMKDPLIALVSRLSQVLISYFDQEPCDNQKFGVVTPSIFVVEEDWLTRYSHFVPVLELSRTVNAISLFAWI
jgi:hypothetical protein